MSSLSQLNLISTLTGCPLQSAQRVEPQAADQQQPKPSEQDNIVVKVVKEPVRLRDIARHNEEDDENFISLRNQFNPNKRAKTESVKVPLREP